MSTSTRLAVVSALLVVPLPVALLLLLVGLDTSSVWLVRASIGMSVIGALGLVAGIWLTVTAVVQERRPEG